MTGGLLACLLPHLEERGRREGGGRERGRERRREKGREKGREGEREGGRERRRGGGREKGREGGRKRGRKEGERGERKGQKRQYSQKLKVRMNELGLTEQSRCKAPQHHHVESNVPPLHVAEGGEEERERGTCRNDRDHLNLGYFMWKIM